jgi:hypothetical protein
VQHPGLVRRLQRVGDLDADVADLGRRHGPVPVEHVVQGADRAQFHDQVGTAVIEHSRVVYVDDVRVPGQPSRRGYLTEEAATITLGEQDPIVDLDRDFPADGELPAPVDGGEAS